MNKTESEKKAGIGAFLLSLLPLIAIAALLCVNIHLISDFFRYDKVYQNPLVVTGTITRIEENEDSEGSTTYIAYISYTIDGTEYTDNYTSSSSRSSLPDYGEKFTVEVNPDDHSELLKNMINPFPLLLFYPLLIVITINTICNRIAKKMLNRESYADEEGTRTNLFVSVLTKSSGKVFLILAISATAFYIRFPFINNWFIGVAAILFIIAACFIGKNIKRINHIKREEYKIVKSTIYDKYEKSDDDSTTYWLCYRDTEHEWKRSVSAKKYHSVEAGTTITSVYIGNATQPEIVYDIDGTEKV